MTIEDQIAVMQHFRDGGEVELCLDYGIWKPIENPSWNFGDHEYRPVPKVREWYEKPENIGKLAMFRDDDSYGWTLKIFGAYLKNDVHCFEDSNGTKWKQARIIKSKELAR